MFAIMLWQRTDEIYNNADHNQASLVSLLNNVVQSLFVTQEKLLDVLGHQLREMGDNVSSVRGTALLDSVLSQENDLAVLLYSDVNGKVLVMSSNLMERRQGIDDPLMQLQDAEQESFQYALEVDKAVLGRTYFMPALGEWVIPIRKRVLDDNGKPIAVISAGLRLGATSYFFNQNIHSGSFHDIMLLRDRDWYLQYLSSDHVHPEIAYGFASSADALELVVKSMGMTIPEARLKTEPVQYRNLQNRRSVQARGMLRYNERYEMWILSEINERHLFMEWLKITFAYIPVMLIVQLVAFCLFRMLNRVESERQRELVFQATHDRLTELPNRNYLIDEIHSRINSGQKFAVFFVDMDNFKGVNDGFGHECGDRVLKDIANRLRDVTSEQDLVVRVGGDEFIVLSNDTSSNAMQRLAENLTSIVDSDFVVDQFRFSLGVSIGVACYPEHGQDLDSLIRAADIAMYEAKKHKNSIRYFEPQMQQSYLRRILIEQKLRSALTENELYVVYQPKVSIDGKLLGVEALARWENADLGNVPPDQFIQVAETSGMMSSIGQFILSTALSEMAQVQQETGVKFPVSVNISVRQFFQEHFLKDLLFIVEHSGLEKDQICLEITESVFIDDIALVVSILRAIHSHGIQLSMDDFGTGYSSLSSLSQLPVDELKIDKSFVDNILHDSEAQKMIQSIIAIGKNHGMTLVAEGVESVQQAELLNRYGCDHYQGYYFSKPLKKDVLKEYIVANA